MAAFGQTVAITGVVVIDRKAVRGDTLAGDHGFPAIRAVARLTSHRRVEGKDTKAVVRYFLLSIIAHMR